jgi:site-specific DNA-methyltransferase (adenine-specific)
MHHFRLPAMACAISRASSARTVRAAHSFIDSLLVSMQQLSIFFAPAGYSTGILTGDCRDVLMTLPAGILRRLHHGPALWRHVAGVGRRSVAGWMARVARVLKPAASCGSSARCASSRPCSRNGAPGFRYSQDIVWEKQNGTGFHNDRFRRVHEHAVLFYRGAWADVHQDPQYTNDATAQAVRRKTRPTHTGHIDGHYVSEDGGPRLHAQRHAGQERARPAIHPTQKPLELLAPLVRYSVPPGGSLIVPFAGSGSECLAAHQEGRHAVGIERDPEMADLARARIAADAPLFAEVACA